MMNWFKKKIIRSLPPLAGYNLWAATYAQESNPVKNLSDHWVEQLLPDLQGKCVLDAGCGTGRFCFLAEKKKAARVIGIDFSPSMIAQAKNNCSSTEFHCAEIADVTLQEECDVIICALVLGHVEQVESSLDRLSRALKTGGELIITDFHPVQSALGAKRTFAHPQTGETLEIRHYAHSLQFITGYLTSCAMEILRLEEALWNDQPVIYALQAKKL
jgi:malonyl-CoA O-methyltransferase